MSWQEGGYTSLRETGYNYADSSLILGKKGNLITMPSHKMCADSSYRYLPSLFNVATSPTSPPVVVSELNKSGKTHELDLNNFVFEPPLLDRRDL
jgi:hypothetical protein